MDFSSSPEFEPVTTEQWKERIAADLKGRPYDTLQWSSPEGILIEPFYDRSDLNRLQRLALNVRPPACPDGALILEHIRVGQHPDAANQEALHALSHGAEAVEFDLQGREMTHDLFDVLTRDIRTDIAPVSFIGHETTDASPAPDPLFAGCVAEDRVTGALRRGLSHWTPRFTAAGSKTQHASADLYLLGEAGAHLVQELGIGLAIINEYLKKAPDGSLRLRVRMSAGSHYFFEIARYRAFRRLARLLSDSRDEGRVDFFVQANGTLVNKSILDPHTNMLRSTVEAMAALLGGADAVCVPPYDELTGASEDGRRWARNISLVLRHEAGLSSVGDPTGGSYYVETLTEQMASSAWELFREIEGSGGIFPWAAAGRLEDLLKNNRREVLNALARRENTQIGVNDYPGTDRPAQMPTSTSSISGDRLSPFRPAAAFEGLRVAVTKAIADGMLPPRALLVATGKAATRRARMNFTSNFLGCAGIDTQEALLDVWDGTVADAVHWVVLCADEDAWPEAIGKLASLTDRPVWLAGDHKHREERYSRTLAGALHRNSDQLTILRRVLEEAGYL